MSVLSATGGNASMAACNCTGACMQGSCYGGHGGYSTYTTIPFAEINSFKAKVNIDIENVRQQVNAQEHTINCTQIEIKECLDRIEIIHPSRGLPGSKIPNPFAYIAVD